MRKFVKIVIVLFVVLALILGAVLIGLNYAKNNQGLVTQKALSFVRENPEIITEDPVLLADVTVFLDILKEIFIVDGQLRRYLVLLQNNLELRPGGGFIGQYAIIEVQDAQVISWDVRDANHLDKDVVSTIDAPTPFVQYLGIGKLEFRDSNWDFDFTRNAQRALKLYNQGPEPMDFDGVFAFNANVIEDLLEISGPVTVPGYEDLGEFTSDGGLLKIQDAVEKPFLLAEMREECVKREELTGIEETCNIDPDTGEEIEKVTDAQRENRKAVLPLLTHAISLKLFGDEQMQWRQRFDLAKQNIPRLLNLAANDLADRDIQIWFDDGSLQEIAADKNWLAQMDTGWEGDYVAVVDANIGALKSDYYINRTLEYTVDFTGRNAQVNDIPAGRMIRYRTPEISSQVLGGTYQSDLPLATMRMSYEHSAVKANYRTSDYHAYTRLYTPLGTQWKVREWFGVPDLIEGEYDNRHAYGYKFDIFIGDTLPTMLQYTLPENLTQDAYALKIQKQSGVEVIPTTVRLILSSGESIEKSFDLVRDAVIRLDAQSQELTVEFL